MNDLGYLYVLANSAMPGLVKVGKTTRNPTDRASELSGVTGLPTPFIVVYEQLFQDCSAAESFVHTYLAKQGFRVADNREFFSAPVNDIVRAIALAPGAIQGGIAQFITDDSEDFSEGHQPDELDDLPHPSTVQSFPWSSVLDQARNFYFGWGDCLQDFGEAVRLFRQAAKLGAPHAYAYLGKIFENGETGYVDKEKALEYYKEGARKGNVYCYWAMGMLFINAGHKENAEKSLSIFLKNINSTLSDGDRMTDQEQSAVHTDVVFLLRRKLNFGLELPIALDKFSSDNSPQLAAIAKGFIQHCANRDTAFANSLIKVLNYLEAP